MKPEPVFEIHGGGYEWYWFAVYSHPRGSQSFAVFSGTGCSCNSPGRPDDQQVQAAVPLPRASVRDRLKDFMTDNQYFLSPGDAIRYLERFETDLSEVLS